MRPRDYVLDRLPLLLASAFALVVLLLVVHLGVRPLSLGDASYIVLLALVASGVTLAVDYQRHRAFRRAVAARLTSAGGPAAPLPRGASREQRALARLLAMAEAQAADKLQHLRSEAEQHRAFVDLWVHQMKTPLAVLELTAKQRQADPDEARAGEAWRSVEAEAATLAHGLDLMLGAARLERFELDLRPTRTDLGAAARQAINELKGSWIRSGVYPRVSVRSAAAGTGTAEMASTGTAEMASTGTAVSGSIGTLLAAGTGTPAAGSTPTPVTAETDPKWLQMVLRQLLTNAIKYSEPGAYVDVTVEPQGDGARLSVADTGIGIAPEDVPRVFERFFTGANGRRGKASTGMGLYLAAQVCRRLGHELSLESAPGVGTTVRVTLSPVGLHRAVHSAAHGAAHSAVEGAQADGAQADGAQGDRDQGDATQRDGVQGDGAQGDGGVRFAAGS